MTGLQILKVNRDAIMQNCITFALWDNRTYARSLEDAAEHAKDYYPGITYEKAKTYLESEWRKVFCYKKELNALITRQRKTLVRPHYETNAQYIAGEYHDGISSVSELWDVIHRIGQ